LLAALDYHGAVTANLRHAHTAAPSTRLSWYELAAMDAARSAGVSPRDFASELLACRSNDMHITIEIHDKWRAC
jgi:hypothetical protein